MKQFIIRVGLFGLLMLAIDFAAGRTMAALVNRAKGGDTGRNNYICNQTNEDMIIFGSSRAIHHYDPTLLTKATGFSVYNCGQDGNGILLHYGRWQMISQRYHPKVIIYDITPGFDLIEDEDNHKYLKWLKSFYHRKGIPQLFADIDSTETLKMNFSLYRYNSSFIQIVSDNVHPIQALGIAGYRPLVGELDPMKIKPENKKKTAPVYDAIKLKYLQRFIDERGQSKLIFVISPQWYAMREAQYAPIKQLCKQNGIAFVNFANSPKYVHQDRWFKDGSHLNQRGAEEFTRDFCQIITRMEGFGPCK